MRELELALTRVRSGDTIGGLAKLKQLCDNPDCRIEALGHCGFILMTTGQQKEALKYFDLLRTENPSDYNADYYAAQIYYEMAEYDTAIENCLSVLAKMPHHHASAKLLIKCQEAGGFSAEKAAYNLATNPALSKKPANDVIRALEADTSSYPGSSFPEVGLALYALTRLIRPAMVVETGTFIGYSTMCIAQALEEMGVGHIHTFDLFGPLSSYTSPVCGPKQTGLEIVKCHLETAGLSHRVSLHEGDSSSNIKKLSNVLAGQVEFAFIDGDHYVKGCLNDWNAIDALLKPGAIVAFHDINPNKCGWMGPRYVLDRIHADFPGRYVTVNLPSPEGFGIGIVQKLSDDLAWLGNPSLSVLLRERLFHVLR